MREVLYAYDNQVQDKICPYYRGSYLRQCSLPFQYRHSRQHGYQSGFFEKRCLPFIQAFLFLNYCLMICHFWFSTKMWQLKDLMQTVWQYEWTDSLRKLIWIGCGYHYTIIIKSTTITYCRSLSPRDNSTRIISIMHAQQLADCIHNYTC